MRYSEFRGRFACKIIYFCYRFMNRCFVNGGSRYMDKGCEKHADKPIEARAIQAAFASMSRSELFLVWMTRNHSEGGLCLSHESEI